MNRLELLLPLMLALVEVMGSPKRRRISFTKGDVDILAATDSLPPETSSGKVDFGCSISVRGFWFREYLPSSSAGT